MNIDKFTDTMIQEGERWGQQLGDLRSTYYDGEYVYRQMAKFLNDTKWLTYAENSRDIYRKYLTDNDYGVAGWMRFPHGRLLDYQTTGSGKEDLIGLRDNGAYSQPHEWSWAEDVGLSREIAYNLEAHICAERAGEPRDHERVNALVGFVKTHLDQWIKQDYYATSEDRQFLQSFMAGMSCRALADYYQQSEDSAVVPLVVGMSDYLWEHHWAQVEASSHYAFRHVVPATEGTGSESPSPDLLHLNSVQYAWCYLVTGEQRHLDRYEEIFDSAANLNTRQWNNKQFHQNHRDVFTGLRYREEGIKKWQGEPITEEPKEDSTDVEDTPQNLSVDFIATGGGRYRVRRQGDEISAHTQYHTALSRAADEKISHPSQEVEVDSDFTVRVKLTKR